jgi:hypothetical protein
MYSKLYTVTLAGQTPLLMHRDNIQWGQRVKAWTKDPANKDVSVPGDDTSPAWTWIGYLYHNAGLVVVDTDNLMTMLRDGGTKCPASKGKGSFKAQTQSGIIITESGWPVTIGGKTVSYTEIKGLQEESDFEAHEKLAQKLGFELFVKRAKIGKNKHVRVRPMFSDWKLSGNLMVTDATITTEVLQNILTTAGRFCGLCDWRPGSPKSGRFGCFTAEVKEQK